MQDFEVLMKALSQPQDPNRIVRADLSHIEAITSMRVAQQVEHWTRTLGEDFSVYAAHYREVTASYLRRRLNHSLFYVIKYVDKRFRLCAIFINIFPWAEISPNFHASIMVA